MQFDFDTLTNRTRTGACKWDRRTDEEKRQGYVPLSIADMEFQVAPCVRRAMVQAAHRGIYGYTDPDGRYYDAVARWMNERHGVQVAAEEICCLYGVVPALHAAVRAFTKPSDRVIVQTPVYYPFTDAILSNNRRVARNRLIERDGRYEMDFDGLEALAREPNTKLLLLCSPHNPVGRVWTREELARLGRICVDNGVVVVSDEIHFDIVLEGRHSVLSALGQEIRNQSLILTAISKTFNAPGLQIANILIANPELRKAFKRQVHIDGYSNISHFGYAATIAAYDEGGEWVDALNNYLRHNAAIMRGFVGRVFPGAVMSPLEGTYLAWVNFRHLGLDAAALESFMRGEAGLFLDEGRIFGDQGEGYERFNIALPAHELRRALSRLEEAAVRRGFAGRQ